MKHRKEGGLFALQELRKSLPRSLVAPRALSLLAVLAVTGLSPVSMAAPSGNPESGRKIYVERCQSCHGLTGKGDSDVAAYLKPPPANLTAKSTQAKTDAELRKVIREGRAGTAMVSFDGVLDEGRLTDLIAYLRSLKP